MQIFCSQKKFKLIVISNVRTEWDNKGFLYDNFFVLFVYTSIRVVRQLNCVIYFNFISSDCFRMHGFYSERLLL